MQWKELFAANCSLTHSITLPKAYQGQPNDTHSIFGRT